MCVTRNLRAQHDMALAHAQEMLEMIDAYRPGDDAFRLTLAVARLLSLLRLHLAQEDVGLYPSLMASGDPDAAALAARFAAEMGSLAQDLEDYVQRWSNSAAIASGFDEFRIDTLNLIAALDVRIERENTILYPLADRLGAAGVRRVAA